MKMKMMDYTLNKCSLDEEEIEETAEVASDLAKSCKLEICQRNFKKRLKLRGRALKLRLPSVQRIL